MLTSWIGKKSVAQRSAVFNETTIVVLLTTIIHNLKYHVPVNKIKKALAELKILMSKIILKNNKNSIFNN